ncbi:hypothetical protein RPPS3_45070 [Rhodopseudomonas palustris]|uniref:hypothetical protein n=1 Tax=Rhodopseudomonas palustris TaxID=1076 RepID=UPI000D225FBB|nr:hypothetical protein [Rhodopseudomonas palustris]AVT78569.1 hypothetical protein RPPS3_45070 [Rhodopseudomonas palustris]
MISSAQRGQFVELRRTFHELLHNADTTDDTELTSSPHFRQQLDWSELLSRPRVAILSEAGSGKTEEIRQTARRLRSDGKAAFFLRLELVPDDFDIAFEEGTSDDFLTWLSSTTHGWLLLDSVDEARLRSPKDFERAIRKIGKLIENAKSRVNIILTARTHAWRPKTDLQLCQRLLGFPLPRTVSTDTAENEQFDVQRHENVGISGAVGSEQTSDDASNALLVVGLDDLSPQQVTTFATERGLRDVTTFVKEIDRHDAWPSTTRPQDLDELIAYWIDKGRIGTRLEMVRNNIDRRLIERDQQRAEMYPLPDAKAREGVTLLAAATTLAQNPTIRVPDGAETSKGIDPRLVLPTWSDAEIATLLSRPIFDDAIYGSVRFYHRSVREYLAASWLQQLLERPSSRRAIESLIIRVQYNLEVIVPTLRPILPWLAIFDERIRQRLRSISPEIFFEGGDPSALPLALRIEILTDICGKISSNKITNSATEYAAIQRFVQVDIAEHVRSLLARYSDVEEVVRLLMRVVQLGHLTSLLPEAKQIATSRTTTLYSRVAAVRALRDIGTPDDQFGLLTEIANEPPPLPRALACELLSGLQSSRDVITAALGLIEKIDGRKASSFDRLEDDFTTLIEGTGTSLLPDVIERLNDLLTRPPVVERFDCEISQKYSWTIKAAIHAVERLAAERSPQALSACSLDIIHKISASANWNHHFEEMKEGLERAISDWRELNDASFWHDVSVRRQMLSHKTPSERLINYRQAQMFGALWRFVADDFDRVFSWIEARADRDDRLVSLTLAFAIYAQNDKPKDWIDRLTEVGSSDPELKEMLRYLSAPSPQYKQQTRQFAKYQRKNAARAKRQSDQLQRDTEFVIAHVDLLRNSQLPNPDDLSRIQWYLHERLRETGQSSNKWADSRWRELIPTFGVEVATAYRDSAIRYWRHYQPTLRSEGAKPHETPNKVIFGLSGLAIESQENPRWIEAVNSKDADRATRYALLEMNGFPEWFPRLYSFHKETALRIIIGEIEYELRTERELVKLATMF